MLRRVGPKVLVLLGVVQGALHWAGAQLDVLGRLAGSGFGWVLVAGLVVAGVGWEVGRRHTAVEADQVVPPVRASRVRQELINTVRLQWISGVLDRSLEMTARIEVGLTSRPDVVDHPWSALVPGGAVRPPPSGLLAAYDESRTGLLVLGEPGVGKTTALLELARDVLCRAEQDPGLPVPVVFHLSSWTAEHTRLADWLCAELTRRYGVPRGRCGR